MRHAILTSFLMGLLAVTAWAQEEGEREQQRGDRPRGERRIGQERRERGPGEQRGGGRDRGPGMDRMWTRVADELDLDEEQRVQFDEISAKYRERMREAGQRWQEVREEMREAREAGDEERVRELRAEMRGGRESEGAFAEALEELEPILREDQVARLWELQDRMQGRGQDRERYRRVINDLPDELDLSDEQRDEFEQLLNSQREKMRERWSDVQPLMDEMREARQAGDEERVRELQEQLEQTRPSQEAMFEAFFVELKDMLT
ncbi:MAG: Spy/CpxP family protein refolding chaperone, partial [Planctomycetes bacterium]|nr:Spy/CpxP family protein refolding chaperone [Planctomycetota bacterium]